MKSFLKSIVVAILTLEAQAVLARQKPKIVAVTGNVGKTSTKDAVAVVMEAAVGESNIRKSKKSFNSEIGLPLTILGLETAWSSASGWFRNLVDGFKVIFSSRASYPEWLVLEIGADHPGDIEHVSKWLRPDVVVLTRMSDVPVHVEFFAGPEAVLREKMFLAKALKPGGVLVVNADDPHFKAPVAELSSKKVFYGSAKGADVSIESAEVMYDAAALSLPTGQSAVIRAEGKDLSVALPGVLGGHLVYPVAAAVGVAVALGIPKLSTVVSAAFRHFESPKGRMRILPGKNSSAIIDDTYNSSPLACAEALKSVGRLSSRGRKIAVLGDMKELGDNAEKAHRDIGALAADVLHTLVTVGDMARQMAFSALAAGMTADRIMSFDTSDEAAAALVDIVRAGDVVLVKGSQSMRMERVSKALLAEPEKAGELLVRQEEEWRGR